MKTAILALLLTLVCAGPVILLVMLVLRALARLHIPGDVMDGLVNSVIIALILTGVFHVIDGELRDG